MIATEPYAAAWKDRRLRMAVFRTVQLSGLPVIFVAAYLFNIYRSKVYLVVTPAWFLGFVAVGVWLNRFRCPRCGKLYYWRLERKPFAERLKAHAEEQKRWRDCRHCGLQQDAEPMREAMSLG